ncbi:hypothetical protein IEQ34_002199 [Dendrobium chrysotoxum]|uniref:Uncharacterized protein n=1 Tax=Dendrobium chrysotoxum TaxID=161865 RepID=A0AAV7HKN8_DENCH|nr:hypothetical protein IEQ34_002199 [Dendrobium chrysotoxum]
MYVIATNANTAGKPSNSKPAAHPAISPSAEMLHSDGESISRSEVTSMYSPGTAHFHATEHLRPSLHHHHRSSMIIDDSTRFSLSCGGTAVDGCCNFLKI